MPLQAQVKLLRALQEKEIVRVGATRHIKVDVRVIAATNRDLKSMIAGGRFRQDLYYRISTFEIQVAPLRDRRADIPSLAHHFLEKLSSLATQPLPMTIEEDALNALASGDKPTEGEVVGAALTELFKLDRDFQKWKDRSQKSDASSPKSAELTAPSKS